MAGIFLRRCWLREERESSQEEALAEDSLTPAIFYFSGVGRSLTKELR